MIRKTVQLVALLMAVASVAVGQTWKAAGDIREGARGSVVGTVVDVDDARNQLQLEADSDQSERIMVRTDSVTTQYNGFGRVIGGNPEIFTGSKGFTNVRVGDRLEVRGLGRGIGSVTAERVTLLGRSLADPTQTTARATDPSGRISGIIRQVNADENRIVVETEQRQLINIRTVASTPVFYKGASYRVRDLEVGDRIRVEPEAGGTASGEVRARVIDVTISVQESGEETRDTRRVTSVAGKVTKVDRNAAIIDVDTGRETVRVDMVAARDADGKRVRAGDVKVGERVDISGSFGSTSKLFIASTIRLATEDVFSAETRPAAREDEDDDDLPVAADAADLVAVTIYGTIRQALDESPQLLVRDNEGKTLRIHVLEDFIVRTKSDGYTTAARLRQNDSVVVKALRDDDNNFVAQSIRIR